MGRKGLRFGAMLAVFASGAAACGLFPNLDGLSTNVGDEDFNEAAKNDGTSTQDTGPVDSGTKDAPADVANGCPSGRGPLMVAIDSKTCIDTTEVTVAQYRAFASSVDAGFPQSPECAFNTSFIPLGGMPSTSKDQNPIAEINWCQAQAFCAWAGKSLCGAPDGGSYAYAAFATPSQSTWMNACSAGGTQTYPYGSAFDASACNLAAADASSTVAPAGSFAGCRGSVPGLFDMIGNVTEWDNACLPSADASADLCRRRGSGYDDPSNPSLKTCAWDEADPRTHQSGTTGARCCAYLP